MAFCLPKEFSDKFREALRNGEIIPDKLAEMASAERRAFFERIVGEADAADVNAMFESKLLLKDQKRGMVTWAKKVANLKPEVRKDLIARIEKIEKVLDGDSKEKFLEDLAAQKLGTRVSFEEAQNIVRLSKEAETAREAIPVDSKIGTIERVNYGLKYVEFQNYVRELKTKGESLLEEIKADKLGGLGKAGLEIAGTAKSLLSALDNSFFGRQGIKVLYADPLVWTKNFAKSFGDIARELGKRKTDIEPIDLVKADIYSRPNAINGKYENMKLDIGLTAEEAFPSSLPGKVYGLGRLYKASETAFQGAALRMRADLADKLIARAEEFGVDFTNKGQAKGIGELINSMTGRGGLGALEPAGRVTNVLFFSPKFLAGNINTLTAHRLGYGIEKGKARDFVRRESAKNLAKIVGTTAAILFVADQLNPGSVEWDPRSSKFGKIKVGETYFDITGGMAPIVTVASRLVPSERDGKWGLWFKSATTGKWTDLKAGKYGQMTALDVMENFLEGKLAPVPGLFRDAWRGQNFQGEKVTPSNALLSLITPLPVQSALQRKDIENFATPEGFAGLILEGLGLSASTYQPKK